MNVDKDPAEILVDRFKKEGYFDRLKHDILNSQVKSENDVSSSLEESIKQTVNSIVKSMIQKDENLIFKNRGTTSALIEAQLYKDNYKKLEEGEKGIDINSQLMMALESPQLLKMITEQLTSLTKDKESLEKTKTME